VLRVCADPNNLPFSNEAGEGFENRIAELLASDLGAKLEYTWWAQRRGFVRNTLKTGACDVMIGAPTSFDMVLTTRGYYRSTYVFVTAAERALGIGSLDDPRLRELRIAVQLVGDDAANTPPAHALARRGIVDNVVGYTVYGDYSRPNPPAEIVAAVARGDVDVAIAWGPLAGYFAPRQPVALDVAAVTPHIDMPFLPFVFDVGMGVRHGERALREELDAWIVRRRDAVDAILAEYGVPRTDRPSLAAASPQAHRPAQAAPGPTPAPAAGSAAAAGAAAGARQASP
jgi:mxaJ protein